MPHLCVSCRCFHQAVFRAPDLSAPFVEAMDTVVNQLLKVKDQDLLDIIADIAREVSARRGGEGGALVRVGL